MFMENIRFRGTIVLTIVLAGLISAVCLAGDNALSEDTVFATFRGGTITKADFDEQFDKIPIMYRSRFSTLDGQEEFLNSLIINEIFYLKALEEGIDALPSTLQAIEEELERFYSREYIRREITGKIKLSEKDVRGYYEEFPGRFTESANTAIQYIKVDESDVAEKVRQELDRGTDFIDLMNRYSINQHSKRNQGVIRNIRGNGYIQGVGRDEELDNAIKEAEMNKWKGPLHTEIGYHFFKVTQRTPSRLKPLEEVRHEIESRLRPMKEYELRQQRFQELKEKYSISIDEETLHQARVFDARLPSDILDKTAVNSDIEELQIRVRDIRSHIQTISPQERTQLNNPEHLIRMVDSMIENRLFAHEARQKGYEEYILQDPDAQQVRRNTILRALYQKLVVDQIVPTPEEVLQFYNQNINSYTRKEHRTIQFFAFDRRRDARRARQNVSRAIDNEDENSIEAIIEKSLYTANKGIIPNFHRDSGVSGFDDEKSINEVVWETEPNEVSKVNRTSDRKYYFVRILEDNPAVITPLEEVEGNIKHRLSMARREERWRELQDELLEEFDVVTFPKRLAMNVTARELFDLAEDALRRKRHNEALDHYDRIIEIYNNNEDDYKALFMKAFLLAEELNKNEEAIALFEQLVNNYPHADLHESAEFMIKSLKEGYDIFDD